MCADLQHMDNRFTQLPHGLQKQGSPLHLGRKHLRRSTFTSSFPCFDSQPTYHVWANLGSRAKHQLTLSVGIVDLTREEGGQLVRPAHRLIEEALSIASASKKTKKKECEYCKCKGSKKSQKSVYKQTNAYMYTHFLVVWRFSSVFSDPPEYQQMSSLS